MKVNVTSQNNSNISTNLYENIKSLKEKIPIGKSFDLITREIQIGSHMGYYVLING